MVHILSSYAAIGECYEGRERSHTIQTPRWTRAKLLLSRRVLPAWLHHHSLGTAVASLHGDEYGMSQKVPPWELMGRMVSENSVAFDDRVQQGLIRSAAARASGVSLEEFEAKLQVMWSWRRELRAADCLGFNFSLWVIVYEFNPVNLRV